jgi:hypothetical protein
LRRLCEDDDRREVNSQHADKIARMLARLDVATRPECLTEKELSDFSML